MVLNNVCFTCVLSVMISPVLSCFFDFKCACWFVYLFIVNFTVVIKSHRYSFVVITFK